MLAFGMQVSFDSEFESPEFVRAAPQNRWRNTSCIKEGFRVMKIGMVWMIPMCLFDYTETIRILFLVHYF